MAVTLASPDATNSLSQSAREADCTLPECQDSQDFPAVASCSKLPEEESPPHEKQKIGAPHEKPLDKSAAQGTCSYQHLWKSYQENIPTEAFRSLEEEVRQNCYSPCEFGRAER